MKKEEKEKPIYTEEEMRQISGDRTSTWFFWGLIIGIALITVGLIAMTWGDTNIVDTRGLANQLCAKEKGLPISYNIDGYKDTIICVKEGKESGFYSLT